MELFDYQLNGVNKLRANYSAGLKRQVFVVMTGGGKFIEVQGTAEGEPFDGEDLHKLLELAKKGIGQLIDIQKKTLGI